MDKFKSQLLIYVGFIHGEKSSFNDVHICGAVAITPLGLTVSLFIGFEIYMFALGQGLQENSRLVSGRCEYLK